MIGFNEFFNFDAFRKFGLLKTSKDGDFPHFQVTRYLCI
jgi:hypothetical protein